MRISSYDQLKALVKNEAHKFGADPSKLYCNYMMQRFLERMARSKYKDHFVLKGGMLVSSLVGFSERTTMDMDAALCNFTVTVDTVTDMVNDLISMTDEDAIEFVVTSIGTIIDEAEYSGVRVSMVAHYCGLKIPVKFDFSVGSFEDTPPIRYDFELFLERKSVSIWAYDAETILAEKLQTFLDRGIQNSRSRDMYDMHMLLSYRGDRWKDDVFRERLKSVLHSRDSEYVLGQVQDIWTIILVNDERQQLWVNYQNSFDYAKDISWDDVMNSVKELCEIGGIW